MRKNQIVLPKGMSLMLPEMTFYISSAEIVSSPDGRNILSMLASSFIVMVRQGWLDIIWVPALVTCRWISGVLCMVCIFTIFTIFHIFRNSINGVVSPIPSLVSSLPCWYPWIFQDRFAICSQDYACQAKANHLWSVGRWLMEVLWNGTKMDPTCV